MAFNCDQCDASYPVRKSLVNHKRLKHGDAKQFSCQQCVYETKNRSHLEQHIRSQHEKVKEICEVCGNGFSDRSKLNRHVKKFHHADLQEKKESQGVENLNKRKATDILENDAKRNKGSLRCSICTAEFKELKNLNKHVKNIHRDKNIKCDNCSYTTNDSYNFKKHKEGCDKRKREEEVLEQVAKRARTEEPLVYSCNQGPNEDEPSDENQSCFGGSLYTKIWNHKGSKDILIVMEKYKQRCKNSTWFHLKQHNGITFYITLETTLFKTKQNGEIETRKAYFCGKNRRLLDMLEFDELYEESKAKIWKSFEKWLKEGSGWRIQSVNKFILKICKYRAMKGSLYIKSPKKIELTHSVTNVQNQDNKCFLWSVAAKLYPAKKHTERVSHYEPYIDDLKVDGISMPMRLDQIPKFEKLNDLTINVYMTDTNGNNIWPVFISKRRGSDPINMLLLSDGEKSHYTLIRDFDRLLSYDTKHPKMFCPYCLHGYDKRYTNEEKMKAHMDECFKYGGQKIQLPEEGENTIEFKDIHKQHKLPFCIYADFECLLTNIEDDQNKKSKKISKHEISGYSYCITSPYFPTEHKSYRGKDAGERFVKKIGYEGSRLNKLIKGANAKMVFGEKEAKQFMESTTCHICEEDLGCEKTGRKDHLGNMKDWLDINKLDTRRIPNEIELKKAKKEFEGIRYTWKGNNVLKILRNGKGKVEIDVEDMNTKTVKLSELKKTHEYTIFTNANDALKEYLKKNDCRVVRDHCHWTGEFRGAAHNHCNRQFRKTYKIPVFFHNLSGYDGHFIFENLVELNMKKAPQVIAKSLEKFISIKLGSIEFKDSAQFLNSSLDKLVKNLKNKGVEGSTPTKDTFPNTYAYFKKKWKHVDDDGFELLTRKGVYPYEYMDRWERMKETELPPKEEYFSKLTGKGISDKDYEFAQEIWKTFKLKTLGQLHDLYMTTDVTLLADVFEEFRETSLKHYKLDPAHFLTAPGLSWSACLKYTRVKLELPTDIDMSMFFDKGLIGGISLIANQYARANHAGLGEHFDPNKLLSFILMVDCNNQYGWSMSQYLPTGGFKWLNVEDKYVEEWVEFLKDQKEEQNKGYFLEVDLEYPRELHDLHDTFPCAPEHVEIKEKMLSDYQKKMGNKLGVKYGGEKLCLTLHDKEKYVMHYRNLQQYLDLGLKLKKVHRVLEFKQSKWLEPYIKLNTELRRNALCKFDEDQAKLMNNSYFGKTCENVRSYKEVKIVTDKETIEMLGKKEKTDKWRIYNENLAAVMLERKEVKLNKPRYVGTAILGLSKVVMYNFHYNYIMENFPGAKLLFTDTDSFCYWLPTNKDIYKEIKENEWFDFSNYSPDHPNFNENKKLIPGFFKDEFGGKFLLEVCGLRAKMYSILPLEGDKKATAKGINKNTKDDVLTHQNYKDSLFNQQQMTHTMVRIAQERHQLYTMEIEKKSLSPFNDKKYITRDGDNFLSYSYGHYKIEEEE